MVAAQAPESTEMTMRALLEAGVHFGHQVKRWNPRMRPFIFGERDGIHIIDLHQTALLLEESRQALQEITERGGKVLFVGTKKQAQEVVATEATRCGMFYVNRRWLGGTLTNFRTIRSRLEYLRELEYEHQLNGFRHLPRQEAMTKEHEMEKLNRNLGGMKNLNQLPAAVVIVDTRREELAVKEARRVGIPVFAMLDSNSDPDVADYIIPGNDDAIRSIRLVLSRLSDAVIDGLTRQEVGWADQQAGASEYDYAEADALAQASEGEQVA